MSAVVGIDLGTTNTVVAHVRDGRAVALADESGERLIPSVVSFHPSGQVVVGRAAKERRLQDPQNTIYSVKRLIGRPWASEDVQRARERAPFDLREGPGHAVMVVARGETYTLSEISAYVLRKAKSVAEAALGQPVERAVITVPANFNDLQRAATKVAGRVAGLEVLRILNEPTAAALAYGYGKSNDERIAIYDFGGGTFDVTLLDLSGHVFEVLATAGDTFLGGDDVDLAIADRICEAFLRQHRYDPRGDLQVFEHIRAAAETIKHRLSQDTQATVSLREIAFGTGGHPLGLDYTLSRPELEKLILPLVDRTFQVCREALRTAGCSPRDFDQVILVGGSTRIPMVRQRVAEFFGREPLARVSPDEVVAIGAAIQAMALTSQEPRRSQHDPGERKIPTLSGLGEAAQKAGRVRTDPAALRQPTTARGLGGGSRNATLIYGGAPPMQHNLPPGLPGAMTDRAPNTADYVAPEPPPRPPAGPTKLSLGAEARSALARPPEESPVAVLPLIGVAPEPPRGTLPTSPSGGEIPAAALPPPQSPEAPPARPSPRVTTADQAADIPPLDLIPALTSPAPPPLPVASPSPVPVARKSSTVALPSPVVPPAAPPPAPAPPPRVAAPVLIDVTPLSLSVETVGGYCDTIIARNTPIPCDGTRIFATASNNQRVVRVRVAQGESKRFGENTVLGELELTGIREAARGEVEISVTFEIDTDGLLQVRARDISTGREAQARMKLIGAQDSASTDAARARQERQVVV
ncbi:MAG: Hsp70 family protein [Myxococcales bacterium]|nr:Hsp70 family protein [Polyangiaceae bacterium]MDW8251709.1 Hsp70 family protein [Myxococcales bacterium]